MKLKWILLLLLTTLLVAAVYFGLYWFNTQPIRAVSEESIDQGTFHQLPAKNQALIKFVQENGKQVAPTYDEAVCTEFLIATLAPLVVLSPEEKNQIRIITTGDLNQLIESDSSVIKGVQEALVKSGKGIKMEIDDVVAGDLVQFWNVFNGKSYGHCGIVRAVNNEKLVVYSSHPLTEGYGVQEFRLPDKAYFVRLK